MAENQGVSSREARECILSGYELLCAGVLGGEQREMAGRGQAVDTEENPAGRSFPPNSSLP